MEQRRAVGERAAEQRRAVEQRRARATEQQRARAAEQQQRANERRQATEKQRAEQQRAQEQRKQGERPGLARQPDNAPRTAKHEQLRQERTKLSGDQHARLRRAFPMDRDRVAKVRFTKRIGHRIPRSVRLFLVPASVLAIFPYYRDYRYIVEDDTICIVDPQTYEIVDVLDEGTYPLPGSRPQMAELSLTPSERALVLDSIPPDFPQARLQLRLALGAEIPQSVELHEFPPIVLDQVSKLRDYGFVVSQDQVVVVAARDRSIALVLDR